jgi:hypothetical protein
MMEGRYPYIRKTTLDIKPSSIRADNKEEDLTFAVFVNLPSGDSKGAAKEDPGWSLIVSRKDDPSRSLPFEIARGDTFCKLDLSAIYVDLLDVALEAMSASPPSLQYTVRLVKTGTDDTALGNILTLTFCEKPQGKEEVHDSDEYGGRDTYNWNNSNSDDDDDDDEDDDDSDDDDDDDDDDDSNGSDDDDDDDDEYEVLRIKIIIFVIIKC